MLEEARFWLLEHIGEEYRAVVYGGRTEFLNLLKDQKDPVEYNSTYNSSTSFYLHEPKPSQQTRVRQKNDSGISFKMLSKGARDNSFDEGFFDSLNIGGRKSKAIVKDGVVKDWDEGMEDDELASILG